jgi:hypothetical protein
MGLDVYGAPASANERTTTLPHSLHGPLPVVKQLPWSQATRSQSLDEIADGPECTEKSGETSTPDDWGTWKGPSDGCSHASASQHKSHEILDATIPKSKGFRDEAGEWTESYSEWTSEDEEDSRDGESIHETESASVEDSKAEPQLDVVVDKAANSTWIPEEEWSQRRTKVCAKIHRTDNALLAHCCTLILLGTFSQLQVER